MNGCKAGYKDGHKYCVKHRCPCLEESCGHYGELTNADRIRSMSDEELAENLCDKRLTKEMWLKWLKQPAKEDAE